MIEYSKWLNPAESGIRVRAGEPFRLNKGRYRQMASLVSLKVSDRNQKLHVMSRIGPNQALKLKEGVSKGLKQVLSRI